MTNKSTKEESDDLRPEYDLSELLKGGVQGKYVDRCCEGANIVLLDRDVAEAFPTDEAVNEALRLVMKWKKNRGCEPLIGPETPDCGGLTAPAFTWFLTSVACKVSGNLNYSSGLFHDVG